MNSTCRADIVEKKFFSRGTPLKHRAGDRADLWVVHSEKLSQAIEVEDWKQQRRERLSSGSSLSSSLPRAPGVHSLCDPPRSRAEFSARRWKESISPPVPDPHGSRLFPWGVHSLAGPGLHRPRGCWERACDLPRRHALKPWAASERRPVQLRQNSVQLHLHRTGHCSNHGSEKLSWDVRRGSRGHHLWWQSQTQDFCDYRVFWDFLCVWILQRIECTLDWIYS